MIAIKNYLWAIAALVVASPAYAQVGYSGYPTGFTGATCANCSMSGLAMTGANTVNGIALNPPLRATSASLGGSALGIGCSALGTVSVSGAAAGMVVSVTPTAWTTTWPVQIQGYVSAANTVTIQACALAITTPTATTFNVSVQP